MKEEKVFYLDPADLRRCVSQPRKHFDRLKLEELADSMAQLGQEQPVTARRVDNGLEIVAGERRWRAAQLIREGGYGFPAREPRPDFLLAVLVREDAGADREVLLRQLAENVVREDMPPMDEAEAYARLVADFGMTVREISTATGAPKSRVHRRAALSRLPEEWKRKLDDGGTPLWVFEEALHVEDDALLPDVLELAERCRSKPEAHDLLHRRFIRPAKERELWLSSAMDEKRQTVFREFCERELNELPVAGEEGSLFITLDYDVCRAIFPWDSGDQLWPMNAGGYVLADRVPERIYDGLNPVVDLAGRCWGDLAVMYGCPFLVAWDANCAVRVLCDERLIRDADATQAASAEARIFAAKSVGGKRKQQQAAAAEKEEDRAEVADLASKALEMLHRVDAVIRARYAQGESAPVGEVFYPAVLDCIQAGAIGMAADGNPAVQLLAMFDVKPAPAREHIFRYWPGLFVTGEDGDGYYMEEDMSAGMESLCVCSWLLFHFGEWGGDPAECSQWLEVCEFYGMEG